MRSLNPLVVGLTTLLGRYDALHVQYLSTKSAFVPLPKHPFDLPTNGNIEHTEFMPRDVCEQVYLVAYPETADFSITAMTTVVRFMCHDEARGQAIRYLRRIDYGDANSAKVYFELGTYNGVFIAGGTSRARGTDSVSTWKLQSIFDFLATVFGLKIEKHLIALPEPPAMRVDQMLVQQWADHNRAASAFFQSKSHPDNRVASCF